MAKFTLPLHSEALDKNTIYVENKEEARLSEALIDITRIPNDLSYHLADEVSTLGSLPVEVADQVEDDDIDASVFIKGIDIFPFQLSIEFVSKRTIFGAKKFVVSFEQEDLRVLCDALGRSAAVKIRVGVYANIVGNESKRLTPYCVKEVFEVISNDGMPMPGDDLFENGQDTAFR